MTRKPKQRRRFVAHFSRPTNRIELYVFLLTFAASFITSLEPMFTLYAKHGTPPLFWTIFVTGRFLVTALISASFISISVFLLRNHVLSKLQPGHYILLIISATSIVTIVSRSIVIIHGGNALTLTFGLLACFLTSCISAVAFWQLKENTWWRLFFIIKIVGFTCAAVLLILNKSLPYQDAVSIGISLAVPLLELLIIIFAIRHDRLDLAIKYDKLHWTGVIFSIVIGALALLLLLIGLLYLLLVFAEF